MLFVWIRRFNELPRGLTFPCTVAQLPENVELNRFPHLLAYDHSRVQLERPGEGDSDYINANYVPGYDRRRKAYIAAQSPFNERTICDFWLMVYQQRVDKVNIAGLSLPPTESLPPNCFNFICRLVYIKPMSGVG